MSSSIPLTNTEMQPCKIAAILPTSLPSRNPRNPSSIYYLSMDLTLERWNTGEMEHCRDGILERWNTVEMEH